MVKNNQNVIFMIHLISIFECQLPNLPGNAAVAHHTLSANNQSHYEAPSMATFNHLIQGDSSQKVISKMALNQKLCYLKLTSLFIE